MGVIRIPSGIIALQRKEVQTEKSHNLNPFIDLGSSIYLMDTDLSFRKDMLHLN